MVKMKDDNLKEKENIREMDTENKNSQDTSPTPPSKPLRAHEETLAKIDPRLRKIYEYYGKWAKVARKFGYTERGIASWVRNGIPECREGRVNEVVREIEGKRK